MKPLLSLINQLGAQFDQLRTQHFLAPCVPGGKIKVRLSRLVYEFRPQPENFQGWGLFEPIDEQTAQLVDEPTMPMIAKYLAQFSVVRVILAYRLVGQAWLAYPVNESDFKQRGGVPQPLVVQLNTTGQQFEQIIARYDGSSFWFDEVDRRADPSITRELGQALSREIAPTALRFAMLTPEMRTVYQLEFERVRKLQAARLAAKLKAQRAITHSTEYRLREALWLGGRAQLQGFQERDKAWLVDWSTKDGSHHTSTIAKRDLTVLSAGICLSGKDNDFDLQSLVKVVEQRGW